MASSSGSSTSPIGLNARKVALFGGLFLLIALFLMVVLRSGPLPPVPVTVAAIESRSLTPALFGIGTVEARFTYKIGPTASGRIRALTVQVGERVRAGQVLGEMDPLDLDERLSSQSAAIRRAAASVRSADAQLRDFSARAAYAEAQLARYETLLGAGSVSEELVAAKRQERQVTEAGRGSALANLESVRQELERVRADRTALARQRTNLRLVAPVDGLVVRRDAEPGSTVVVGQTVLEVIDPASLWVNVRFDQQRATGLRPGLEARLVLRSGDGRELKGHLDRIEPLADVVTEEILAKVTFDALPGARPPIGELAEVTVALPSLSPAATAPGASLHQVDGRLGVWLVEDGALRFAPVKAGPIDLDGRVQLLDGVKPGDRAVVYSQRELKAHSRINIVEHLAGTGGT